MSTKIGIIILCEVKEMIVLDMLANFKCFN